MRISPTEIAEDVGNITIRAFSTDSNEREAFINIVGKPVAQCANI